MTVHPQGSIRPSKTSCRRRIIRAPRAPLHELPLEDEVCWHLGRIQPLLVPSACEQSAVLTLGIGTYQLVVNATTGDVDYRIVQAR